MSEDSIEKFSGISAARLKQSIESNPMREEIEILRQASLDTGDKKIDGHTSSTAKKFMFSIMTDPTTTPRQKWDELIGTSFNVVLSDGAKHPFKLFTFHPSLVCVVGILKGDPALRKDPEIQQQIKWQWSDYAERSEVGPRPKPSWAGPDWKPTIEDNPPEWYENQRRKLPEFLLITKQLEDIVKPKLPGEETNMYEYWSQYIPELKTL